MVIESTTLNSTGIGEDYQQSTLCVNNNLPNRPYTSKNISCTFVNLFLKFPFHKKSMTIVI